MVEPLSSTTSATSSPSPRRGEGRGAGIRLSGLFPTIARNQQLLPDRLQHTVGVGKHITIPEAQYTVAVFLDDRGAGGVSRGVMLSAVQLDGEPGGSAGEVGNIEIDLELADEFLAFEPAGAQAGPEDLFNIGLVGAQLARDWSQAFPSQLSAPSPNHWGGSLVRPGDGPAAPIPAGERAYPGAYIKPPRSAILAS
jgi:hypothetical protein